MGITHYFNSFASNLTIALWRSSFCCRFKKRSNDIVSVKRIILLVWTPPIKYEMAIASTNLTHREGQYCNLSNIGFFLPPFIVAISIDRKLQAWTPINKGCTKHCGSKTNWVLMRMMVLEEILTCLSTLRWGIEYGSTLNLWPIVFDWGYHRNRSPSGYFCAKTQLGWTYTYGGGSNDHGSLVCLLMRYAITCFVLERP